MIAFLTFIELYFPMALVFLVGFYLYIYYLIEVNEYF